MSEYNIKGDKVCIVCDVDTCHHQLQKGKKIVYLGHQKFLRPNHPYHRLQKAFNWEYEFDIAPKPLTKREVYKRQKYINVVFWKKQKNGGEKYLEKEVGVL